MAYSSKVGSFNIDTTKTAGQTQAVSGLGFQPKIVLFWWSGSVATGDSVAGGTYNIGFGAAISSSSRFCVMCAGEDGQATSDGNYSQNSTEIMRAYTDTATLDGILDFSSLDADGFTLVVDNQFTQAYRISYLALGGTDLSNVLIGNKATNTSTGNYSVDTVGFQPDAMLLASCFDTSVNGSGPASKFMLGIATGGSNQGVTTLYAADNAGDTIARGYGYNGEIIALPSTSITVREALVSFDSSGFTINNLEANGFGYIYHYIALKGGQYSVGDITTRTDGNDIAETVGFQPVALLFASANRALSTQDTPTAHGRLSIGAATSTTNRGVQAVSDESSLADSETAFANYDTAVYAQVVDDATVGLMDIKSIDASGFTAVMDDADPSACWVTYLAIGASAASGSSYNDSFSLPKQGNLITSLLLTVNESVFLAEQHETLFSDLLVAENSFLLNKNLGINISVESIYSDLISLEKSLNVLISETTDHSVAFALNRQLFILSDAIRSLENSISLGRIVDISFISEAVYSTIFTLAKQLNISVSSIQTTEESFAIGKQLNILTSADIVHSMALSLAKSLSIGYLAGTNYVDSISLANQLSIAIEELKTLELSFSLNKQLSITELANVIYLTIFSLSKSNNISLSSIATYDASVVLAQLLSLTTRGGADYYDDVVLAKRLSTVFSVLQTINEAVILDKQLGIDVTPTVIYLASFVLSKSLGLSVSSTAVYETILSLVKILSINVSGGADYQDTVNLIKQLSIALSTLQTVNADISLGKQLSITTIANAVYLATVSLAKTLDLSLLSTATYDATVSFIRSLAIALVSTVEGGAQTYNEAFALSKSLGISKSALLDAIEAITLARSLAFSTSVSMVANNSFSLGKELSTSLLASLLLDFTLSFIRQESISTSKTLTLEETLGLTEYLDISDSALATMVEQLSLGKSVGISTNAQLIAEDDFSLGKILVLQVSGGLSYDEAFILSLVKAILISSLLVTFAGQLPLQLRINDQAVWLITAKDTLVTHSGIIKSDNFQADIIGKDTDHV